MLEAGQASAEQRLDVYIAWMGEKAYPAAVRVAKNLRQAGFSVELPPAELKFGKALSHADKLAARYALILGENEIAGGQWTRKRTQTFLLVLCRPEAEGYTALCHQTRPAIFTSGLEAPDRDRLCRPSDSTILAR